MNRGVDASPHLFVHQLLSRNMTKSEPFRDAPYQLVIRGEVDDRYGYLFEGMQMERAEGTTVLAGTVRDQAQLYGLIERIEELGLQLLSVQQADAARAHRRERNEA